MYWIYIPPIVLIVALVAFLIMLGRKSSELKGVRLSQSVWRNPDLQKNDWKKRFKTIGMIALHGIEKFLGIIKVLSRHIEKVISGWVSMLQARRNGKKEIISNPESIILDKKQASLKSEITLIHQIEESAEISENLTSDIRKVKFAGSGMLLRRQGTEEPTVPVKKELLPENKVKESALIYRIAENPKDIEAYREIGDYYLGIGNVKDAKESFKMVLKLRPRDLKAKSSLREIEMRMRLGS